MNESENEGRSVLELVHFGIVFYGAVLGAGGLVANCLPLLALGGVLGGWGILFFAANQFLSD